MKKNAFLLNVNLIKGKLKCITQDNLKKNILIKGIFERALPKGHFKERAFPKGHFDEGHFRKGILRKGHFLKGILMKGNSKRAF